MKDHHDAGGRGDASGRDADGHFDEVEAVRRFPGEEQWLDLPMPAAPGDAAPFADGEPFADGVPFADRATFADRVLAQKRADERLDRDLAELDAATPADWWLRFEAPAPSADFVDETLAAVQRDRRQRWQSMLARYVAPEPSPAFVSRTLAALATSDVDERAGDGPVTAGGDPTAPAVGGHSQSWPMRALRGGLVRNRAALLAVAAAAMALLWLVLTPTGPTPLELRLARRAPTAVAYAEATSPLAAVLARVAADDEPFALFDAPADGLWLQQASGGQR